MHTYIVLFTLLPFSRVAASVVLLKVLSVAKWIYDIYEELPNSPLFIMKTDRQQQSKTILNFFPARIICFWKNFVLSF